MDYGDELDRMWDVGLRGIEIDYDDTLIPTAKMIVLKMKNYANAVGNRLGRDPGEVFELLEKYNNHYYSTLFVNPVRWIVASDMVSLELTGRRGTLRPESDILMSIFDTAPDLHPGVKSILNFLSQYGFKIGIVTHAPLDWTLLKLSKNGLEGIIDGLTLADVNSAKGIEDWLRGLGTLGLRADQVIGVGDSVKGDAEPMVKLGFRGVLLLPTVWHVTHAQTPTGAVPIRQFNEFFVGVEKALAGKI